MAELPEHVEVRLNVEVTVKPRRRGRLKVISDGRFENTQVYVVTEDGEEIDLSVNAVAVRADAGEAVLVDLTAYAIEVDVAEYPVLTVQKRIRACSTVQKRIRACSTDPPRPTVYPEVELTPPSNRVAGVRWSLSFLKPFAKIFTNQLPAAWE